MAYAKRKGMTVDIKGIRLKSYEQADLSGTEKSKILFRETIDEGVMKVSVLAYVPVRKASDYKAVERNFIDDNATDEAVANNVLSDGSDE